MRYWATTLGLAVSLGGMPVLAQGLGEAMSVWGNSAGMGAGLNSSLSGIRKNLNNQFGKAAGSIPTPQYTPEQIKQAEAVSNTAYKAAVEKEKAGKHQEAAKAFADFAAYREKTFGSRDKGAMDAYAHAAKLAEGHGDKAGAENYLREALAVCARKNGPGSPESVPLLTRLRENCVAQEKWPDAVSFGKQELALEERRLGEAAVQPLRLKIADLCIQGHDLTSAETYYKQAIDVAEKSSAADNSQLADALQMYANVLRAEGKQDEATAIAERAAKLAPASSSQPSVPESAPPATPAAGDSPTSPDSSQPKPSPE